MGFIWFLDSYSYSWDYIYSFVSSYRHLGCWEQQMPCLPCLLPELPGCLPPAIYGLPAFCYGTLWVLEPYAFAIAAYGLRAGLYPCWIMVLGFHVWF